ERVMRHQAGSVRIFPLPDTEKRRFAQELEPVAPQVDALLACVVLAQIDARLPTSRKQQDGGNEDDSQGTGLQPAETQAEQNEETANEGDQTAARLSEAECVGKEANWHHPEEPGKPKTSIVQPVEAEQHPDDQEQGKVVRIVEDPHTPES